jgi:hypothetical protein
MVGSSFSAFFAFSRRSFAFLSFAMLRFNNFPAIEFPKDIVSLFRV